MNQPNVNQNFPVQPTDDQQDPFAQGQDPQVVLDSQQDANDNIPVTVPTNAGSLESAPVPVANESAGEQAPEFGYEQIQNMERSVEGENSSEQGEQVKPQEETEEIEPEPTPIPPPVTDQKPQGPRFFGYQIPQVLTSNLSSLRSQVGKGDPVDARTWMVVLLDRLLQKQSNEE